MTLGSIEDNHLVTNAFPVGMQNCALVLQDEEGNSAVAELDELSSVSEQNIGPSSINIENSKDVIIGPVTQFNGPVTIYQNVNGQAALENSPETRENNFKNGKLVKSESTSSDSPHATEKQSRDTFLYTKHLKYTGIPIILLIIAVVITCAVIFSSKSEIIDQPRPETDLDIPILPGNPNNSLRPVEPGSFITRKLWNALPPINSSTPLTYLDHPTPLVIISHTAGSKCPTFERCRQVIKNIQAYHMNEKFLPDIIHNFLIGGDANIYEGRGWDTTNSHAPNSIAIGFTGDYTRGHDELTEPMIKAARKLLDMGVDMGKLAINYTVLCHNQTVATQSPGENVYKVVKTWPQFDSRSYINKKK